MSFHFYITRWRRKGGGGGDINFEISFFRIVSPCVHILTRSRRPRLSHIMRLTRLRGRKKPFYFLLFVPFSFFTYLGIRRRRLSPSRHLACLLAVWPFLSLFSAPNIFRSRYIREKIGIRDQISTLRESERTGYKWMGSRGKRPFSLSFSESWGSFWKGKGTPRRRKDILPLLKPFL